MSEPFRVRVWASLLGRDENGNDFESLPRLIVNLSHSEWYDGYQFPRESPIAWGEAHPATVGKKSE